MPPRGSTGQAAGQGGGGHVQSGSSVQAGGSSYYSSGGTRTVSTAGGSKVSSQGRQVRYESPGGQRVALTVMPARTYHRIILAEFVTCVVLISAAPVLNPQPKGSAGQPLSLAAPLVRLTAVCVLFFVLALMGSGARSGKAAAAFGGLVTLGVLLNATPVITGLTAAFTGTPAGAGTAADAEAGEPLPASEGVKG